jgi:hypothetical protein
VISVATRIPPVNAIYSKLFALIPIAMVTMAFCQKPAPTPDDPCAKVPRARYSSVMAGTKTYRPVEPMPWSDGNRREAPKPPQKPAGPRQ